MDGWKVKHVETHGRDPGQARLGLGEGRPARGISALRPRKQLVPSAHPAPFAIDPEREFRRADLQVVARIAAGHQLGQRRIQDQLDLLGGCLGGTKRVPCFNERYPVPAVGHLDRSVDERQSFQQFTRHLLARLVFLLELADEGAESVGPRHHGKGVRPCLVRADRRIPPIVESDVAEQTRFAPIRALAIRGRWHSAEAQFCWLKLAPQDRRPQQLVPVLPDVGGDFHLLTHRGLGGVSAAVDPRRYVLDDDPNLLHELLVLQELALRASSRRCRSKG